MLEDTNTETGSHDGETGSQDDSITNNKTGSQDESNTDNKTGSQDGSITDNKTGSQDGSITDLKTGSDDDSITTGSQDVCSVTILDSNNTDIRHDRPAHMVCECVCACVLYPFYVRFYVYVYKGVETANHAGHCLINLVNVR